MPYGELPVANTSIPQDAPPYPPCPKNQFKCSCLVVEYYTTAVEARKVIPDIFEIDAQPLCRTSVFDYTMSTVGAYSEYIHQIEVTWNNKKFDYTIILILDNESAIFAGREQWGFPKTFGQVELKTKTGSSYVTASVERPKGERVVQLGFTPFARHPVPKLSDAKSALSLHVIPGLKEGAPAAVKELVSSRLVLSGGEFWVGKGSVVFPLQNSLNPFWSLPVIKYGDSYFWENAEAELVLDDTWAL